MFTNMDHIGTPIHTTAAAAEHGTEHR
jgi:hypothetical protein